MIIGGFFLAFAAILQQFYNAAGAFSASGTNTLEGEESPVYAASFGTWLFSSQLINEGNDYFEASLLTFVLIQASSFYS